MWRIRGKAVARVVPKVKSSFSGSNSLHNDTFFDSKGHQHHTHLLPPFHKTSNLPNDYYTESQNLWHNTPVLGGQNPNGFQDNAISRDGKQKLAQRPNWWNKSISSGLQNGCDDVEFYMNPFDPNANGSDFGNESNIHYQVQQQSVVYADNMGEFSHNTNGYQVSQLSANGYNNNNGEFQQHPSVNGCSNIGEYARKFELNLNGSHALNKVFQLSADDNGEYGRNGYYNTGQRVIGEHGGLLHWYPVQHLTANVYGDVDQGGFMYLQHPHGLSAETCQYIEQVKEAVQTLAKSTKEGTCMGSSIYIHLIRACETLGTIQGAQHVYANLMRTVYRNYHKILDLYIERGLFSDAYDLHEEMPEQSLRYWSTLIMGLAKNGFGEDAIDVFNMFKETGLQPDAQMFMGLFIASSTLCDIEEGMLHFESMSKDYGIVPTMEHYVAVVSMLGSTGYLDEAMEFIEKMPFEPSIDLWETLMNLCRAHGNVVLEAHCAEMVNHLDPCHLTDTIIKEREKKIPKPKNRKLSKFRYMIGDTSDDHALLRGVIAHIKELGYVPETKHASCDDLDEESKEEEVIGHHAKFVLVWMLMRFIPRGLVVITRFSYICPDCHNAVKMISELLGREIVLVTDDGKRHSFKNGLCLCNDCS